MSKRRSRKCSWLCCCCFGCCRGQSVQPLDQQPLNSSLQFLVRSDFDLQILTVFFLSQQTTPNKSIDIQSTTASVELNDQTKLFNFTPDLHDEYCCMDSPPEFPISERPVDVGWIGSWASDFDILLSDPIGIKAFTVSVRRW